jgi:hypothetical protein
MVILTMLFGSLSCAAKGYSGTIGSIGVGLHPGETATEVYAALDKGFFKASGLCFLLTFHLSWQ